MERFKNGMIVQHFKRETVDPPRGMKYLYKIEDINIIHSETKERMVLYSSLYVDKDLGIKLKDKFVRPYDMFCSEVDHEKYPDIKQKYRFEEVKVTTV